MSEAGSETDNGSSGSPVRTWGKRLGIGVVLLGVVLGGLYASGVIGAPSAGLEDRGDWGETTDERTEIVTTIWVNNPNPVGVSLGETLTAEYDVYMNGVHLAEGEKSDVQVPTGNSTTQLRTDLLNDQLSNWWVEFVRAGETVEFDVNATLHVDAFASFDHDVTHNDTMLEEEMPVIDALSSAVNETSGDYTRTVSGDSLDNSVTDTVDVGSDSEVTVGYEVQRGWATWDAVTENETTVLFHMQVHNPGDVPVPADPDGVGVAIDMNDVRMFEAESDEFSLRSVDSDAVIQPSETREVTFAVTMDNDRVDDWFTSHVRDDAGPSEEATAVSSQFQVVFEEPTTGTTFRVPGDSPVTYDCEFRTDMLVDGQETGTNCGEPAAAAN